MRLSIATGILLFFFSIGTMITVNSQTMTIGMLFGTNDDLKSSEFVEAAEWVKSTGIASLMYISYLDTGSLENLTGIDLLWFHGSDSLLPVIQEPSINLINNFMKRGGKLLLTLDGIRLINDLGIEPVTIETRHKTAVDEGYGRQLGLHAFRQHPIFDGMNGGAYILMPPHDTTVRIHGFFDNNLPKNGEVVAVDWDYIFLRETSKLVAEYKVDKGRVLAIGGYTVFSSRNSNRPHLELFLENCLRYLLTADSTPVNCWQYGSQQVVSENTMTSKEFAPQNTKWAVQKSDLLLTEDNSGTDFWEVAGERMVIMGEEKAGIKEIWAHPYMALRDYSAGLKFQQSDTILWLSSMTPPIEVRPESFTRKYRFAEGEFTEIITVSPDDPTGMIHYSWSGSKPVDLIIKYFTNFRLMWPYSDEVTKKITCGFDEGLNAMIFTEGNEEFTCLIGSDKVVTKSCAGHFKDFEFKFGRGGDIAREVQIEGVPAEDFIAGGSFCFRLQPEDEINIIISSGCKQEGLKSAEEATKIYLKTAINPGLVYEEAYRHYSELLKNKSVLITTPDATFNEGYRWALIATDRFFVHTPELGKSLVAGYSTTGTGWDGGHKIDGRPGYAWYFGRDGEWSGFALLDYGDFEKVKSILEMYMKFQDLNGKIYHEVSTSGIAHYDAADATPLFIILAGKYLLHSGDTAFIRQNWSLIRKAIDFCLSTDTDHDHLIENTNVGHGWVEGGSLFGSHSSLYLTSCWAEALFYAGIMAETCDQSEDSKFYSEESRRVKDIINSDFWNPEKKYYFQGKFQDGSYHEGQSIMPAIPMYFGQSDSEKASSILPVFAGNSFSTDWGCRIIGNDYPEYNPRSYHSGSVWPLFTGWAAMAEYRYGNPVQGFAHIMNNLMIYKHWGLGYIEEVLNGDTYKAQGVCRHQCWSETMVIQPAIEGMLGFEPDALHTSFVLAPDFPADWDSVSVINIRVADHRINFKMLREDNKVTWLFEHQGPSPIRLDFNPHLPEGTLIRSMRAKDDFEEKNLGVTGNVVIFLDDRLDVTCTVEKGIEVLPQVYEPAPGDSSKGLRIIGERLQENKYTVTVEGYSGRSDTIRIYVNGYKVKEAENAVILWEKEHIHTLEVEFEEGASRYVRKPVILTLE